ncbi:hypothetical protein D3C85_292910 [compost metagenome]
MKELVGNVIKEIYVNEDQSIIRFVTDIGDLCYIAEGDCCSETWFADILFSYRFFCGRKVAEVVELEIPDFVTKMANSDGRTRQEYDEVYGYQIVVERQNNYSYGSAESCDIIFRNSSNGYYGGSCEFMNPENKRHKEKLAESEWARISEDWKA